MKQNEFKPPHSTAYFNFMFFLQNSMIVSKKTGREIQKCAYFFTKELEEMNDNFQRVIAQDESIKIINKPVEKTNKNNGN